MTVNMNCTYRYELDILKILDVAFNDVKIHH